MRTSRHCGDMPCVLPAWLSIQYGEDRVQFAAKYDATHLAERGR